MLVDELVQRQPGTPRAKAEEHLHEFMSKPFDPEGAAEWDRALWGKRNIEAATAQGMGGPDDPHVAQPVNHDAAPQQQQRRSPTREAALARALAAGGQPLDPLVLEADA